MKTHRHFSSSNIHYTNQGVLECEGNEFHFRDNGNYEISTRPPGRLARCPNEYG